MNDELRFELITEPSRLHMLKTEWAGLARTTVRSSPMAAPDWLLTWWSHYSGGRSLAAGAFWDRDTLRALIPLCRRRMRHWSGLRQLRLEYLGSGFDEKDGVCSDYLAPLIEPGFENAVAEAFLDQLEHGCFGSFDECVLEMMDEGSPWVAALRNCMTETQLAATERVASIARFAPLSENWDTYLGGLQKKKRYELRRAMKDFDAWLGERTFTLHRATDKASLADGIEILTALHAARWEREGLAGVFNSRRFLDFHTEYMEQALAASKLELVWLSVDGLPLAAVYCISWQNKLFFYQSGRRPELASHVRLGIVILSFVFQEAMKKEVEEIDFLAGDALYKQLFCTGSRHLVNIRFARAGLRETTRNVLGKGYDLARETRNALLEGLGVTRKLSSPRC